MTDIYAYTNYRTFLTDYYNERKKTDAKFSHRFIQQKVGASSSSWFSAVLKGTVTPSVAMQFKLASLFGFDADQTDFFLTLVLYDQINDLSEKQKLFEKMLRFKKLKMNVLAAEKFEYFRHWYISAIRELLLLFPFKGNFATLAKKLRPPISEQQARDAIEVLLNLGLIKKQAGGAYVPTDAHVKKDPETGQFFSHSYLAAYMELAIQALRETPKEQRDISSVTVHLTPDQFEVARKEIQKLRKKLLQLSEGAKTQGQVYQCNVQIFPTSQL